MSVLVTNVHKLCLFQQGLLLDLPGTRLKIKKSEKYRKVPKDHLQGIVTLCFGFLALLVFHELQTFHWMIHVTVTGIGFNGNWLSHAAYLFKTLITLMDNKYSMLFFVYFMQTFWPHRTVLTILQDPCSGQ